MIDPLAGLAVGLVLVAVTAISAVRVAEWLGDMPPLPRTAHEHLQTVSELHDAAAALLRDSRCHRVVILHATGRGRSPVSGPCEVTIVGEATEGIASRAPQWQARTPDAAYHDLVRRVWRESVVHLVAAQMPPSQLRALYEADGVTSSVVWRCATQSTPRRWSMWYLSVSLRHTMTEADSVMIGRCVDRVASTASRE